MQKIHRYLSLLDWTLGLGTCAYGLITGQLWIAALGAIGLTVALFKPAVRIQKYMESKFLAKKSASQVATDQAAAAEEFYEHAVEVPDAQPQQKLVFTGTIQYGPLSLGASRHNNLKASHLNVYRDDKTAKVPR